MVDGWWRQAVHRSNELLKRMQILLRSGAVSLEGVFLDRLFGNPRTCAPSLTCAHKYCSAELVDGTETRCTAASPGLSANIQAHTVCKETLHLEAHRFLTLLSRNLMAFLRYESPDWKKNTKNHCCICGLLRGFHQKNRRNRINTVKYVSV